MNNNLRRRGIGAGVIAAALLLSSCSTTSGGGDDSSAPPEELSDSAGSPQELNYVPGLFPVSLDIQQYPAEEGVQVASSQVLETLVKIKDGEIQPSLAESWDNPDENTWIFTLRDDVKFSDGSDFVAEDAQKSIERLIELAGPLTPLLSDIEEVRADDDHTLSMITSAPLGTLLSTLSLVFIGVGDQVGSDDYWQAPIGTGPFKVEEYVADDHVRFVRNDEYWGELATLDSLTILNMPEVSAKITALETGEIDVITTIPPDQVDGVKGIDGVNFISEDSYTYFFSWFNHETEEFKDERVRQAMWHAFDVESVVQDLYGDGAEVAQGPIAQAVFGSTQFDQYEYNPEKAKELLAEAGYPDGFTVSLQWPRDGAPNIKSLAQAMISAWSEVGITVDPLEKERAQWIADLEALNWDINLQTNTTPTGDADFTINRLYTCDAYRLGFCDPELDEILDQARRSLDQTERADLFAQASQIIWDQAVGIFPAELKNSGAFRENVEGFSIPTNGIPDFSVVSISGE